MYRGNPWSGGVTSFYSSEDGGGVSEGFGTSRRRHVIQGTDTSSRDRLQVQGYDTSSRCRLTGVRHTTSLSPTRVQYHLCDHPISKDKTTYTGLLGELEHLKIETRLIDEMFPSVMGEYVFLK
jgi:hypothetical protein